MPNSKLLSELTNFLPTYKSIKTTEKYFSLILTVEQKKLLLRQKIIVSPKQTQVI